MPSAAHPVPSALLALSPVMRAVREQLEAFAPAALPVLLVGPTGAGESLLGRFLHERSGRAGAFVDCPCGALDPALAASDLFGHERGAFTGAVARRAGRFAAAAGGTLMLDDFHLLGKPTQYLVVGALGSGAYTAVGGVRETPVTCRIVVGMCEDPDDLVARGKLLADLRERLGRAQVRVPGLAERREEIVPLARALLVRYAAERGEAGPRRFTRSALSLLEGAEWPGNVRQLEHTVWAAWELARHGGAGEVDTRHIGDAATAPGRYADCVTPAQRLALVERALARTGGRIEEAAKLIGAHRNTVRERWRELRGRR